MTKSNMRSAGLRKARQRIQRAEVDRRDQLQTRTYQSRKEKHHYTPEVIATLRWYRGIVQHIRKFFGELFRNKQKLSAIGNLNLTTGQGRHAIFGTKRDSGAQWLRNIFYSGLSMRSTRDGKLV